VRLEPASLVPMAHWVWSPDGWLASLGVLDFAGGTVVHINAGVTGLACVIMLGERKGYGTDPIFPHNLALTITGAALLVAVVAGVLIAILFTQSKLIEQGLFPYAVILQVTPIVAIAPLIIIWVKSIPLALLICAWIVAFFPIVANTTLGLNSADRNLVELFRLYGASRWQRSCGIASPRPFFS